VRSLKCQRRIRPRITPCSSGRIEREHHWWNDLAFDANTILYRFEVDDPSAFTKPWKGELTFERASGPIHEYACHEGNYALPNVLRGFRTHEFGGDSKKEP
jgi:hypothetical protein